MTSHAQLLQTDGSSLKHFNFSGWSADQILEKYESVLDSREKQITDLTIELGTLNETLNSYIDKCIHYVEENDMLKIKLTKKEAQLAQELTNKEILFMKLDRKEAECDEMVKNYTELFKGRNARVVNPYVKGKIDYAKVNEINQEITSKYYPVNSDKSKSIELGDTIDNKGGSISHKELPGENQQQQQQSLKTSARNRIEKLKSKPNNATKINFSNLFEAQSGKPKEEKESQIQEEVISQEDINNTKSTEESKVEDKSESEKKGNNDEEKKPIQQEKVELIDYNQID